MDNENANEMFLTIVQTDDRAGRYQPPNHSSKAYVPPAPTATAKEDNWAVAPACENTAITKKAWWE